MSDDEYDDNDQNNFFVDGDDEYVLLPHQWFIEESDQMSGLLRPPR